MDDVDDDTPAMTPLDELLAEGRLGREGARLLYRIVRAVAVAHEEQGGEGVQAFRRSGVQAFRSGKVKGGSVFVGPERLNA